MWTTAWQRTGMVSMAAGVGVVAPMEAASSTLATVKEHGRPAAGCERPPAIEKEPEGTLGAEAGGAEQKADASMGKNITTVGMRQGADAG
jgi:hypothetical protein